MHACVPMCVCTHMDTLVEKWVNMDETAHAHVLHACTHARTHTQNFTFFFFQLKEIISCFSPVQITRIILYIKAFSIFKSFFFLIFALSLDFFIFFLFYLSSLLSSCYPLYLFYEKII